MLTAYDQYTAEIFDEAGIPVLLVGDSAANNVLGYETTLPVTVDELLPLVRGVSRGRPARAGRGRPAVRLLPVVAGAGAGDVGAVHEGGRRARGEARGRRGRRPAGERAGHRRGPGDGPHRVHPAERARPRWLPGAGPRRRRRPAGARRAGAAGGRRLRRRDGDGPRRRRQARDRRARDPHHRHRRRGRLRRPGARLAGHGRAAVRPDARGSSSSTPTCGPPSTRRPGRSPTTSPAGRTRARSTPTTDPCARRGGGAGRAGQHGPVDSDRVHALRELLGTTGWVERTSAFASTLRRSSTTVGGLLLVGTPTEEPWHLAAHLDDESRFAGVPGAVADAGALVPTAAGTAAPVGDVGATRGSPSRRDGVRRRTRRGTRAAARTRCRCASDRRNDPLDRRRRRRARVVGARPVGRAAQTTMHSSLRGRCRRRSTWSWCSISSVLRPVKARHVSEFAIDSHDFLNASVAPHHDVDAAASTTTSASDSVGAQRVSLHYDDLHARVDVDIAASRRQHGTKSHDDEMLVRHAR